jgi:hypothetical protein
VFTGADTWIGNSLFTLLQPLGLKTLINLDVFLAVHFRKSINKIPTNPHMFYFTLTRLHVSAYKGHHKDFVFTEYPDVNGHQSKLHSLHVRVK